MLKRKKLFFRKVSTSEDEYKFLRRFNTNHLTVKYKKYNNVGVYFLPFHFCLDKTKIFFLKIDCCSKSGLLSKRLAKCHRRDYYV